MSFRNSKAMVYHRRDIFIQYKVYSKQKPYLTSGIGLANGVVSKTYATNHDPTQWWFN